MSHFSGQISFYSIQSAHLEKDGQDLDYRDLSEEEEATGSPVKQ
ncbi:MAG: hypothetical protein PHG00_14420 [Methylococcales bacterium]|nr:hypothetical protein [Methylococcales bacterium]